MSFIRPLGSGDWYDYEVETIHKGDTMSTRGLRISSVDLLSLLCCVEELVSG